MFNENRSIDGINSIFLVKKGLFEKKNTTHSDFLRKPMCIVYIPHAQYLCLDINVVFNGISLSIIYIQFDQVFMSSIRCFYWIFPL